MAISTRFEQLLTDPAPGLHFPPHHAAGVGEHALPARHSPSPPATPPALAELRSRTAACPQTQAELLEFYSRHDGVDLCLLANLFQDEPIAALRLLSIAEWAPYTRELIDGGLSWLLEGLEEMYVPGRFFTLAVSGHEDTRLVLFTSGEYEGRPLANKLFYLAVDPVLGATEPVAESFNGFLDEFARDPVAFLARMGYCHSVAGRDGSLYGDVPDRYLSDIRALPDVMNGKGRPRGSRRDRRRRKRSSEG